ncbi:MAG: acylphosphatase [Thaumarchaeota archaeon]|nr:acylphosphatase [Nitrososphaerota archaeon]
MPTAVVVTVRGKVQRVGYRRYVLDIAQEEGVSGEVRNQNDGTVLVFAQADGKALASFLRRLRAPPPPAFVKDAQERKARPKKAKGFRMASQGLAEEMQEGFGAMQSEFGIFRGEFDNFASRTDKNFTTMNQKYGEISEKLSAIMTQLAEQLQSMRSEAKETATTLNESLKLLREAVDRLPKSP